MDRKKKFAVGGMLLFLCGIFLLAGCSARELESRRFPLVLEIDAQGQELIFACAWPR